MEPFIVNNVIEDINSLYGRSKCIDALVSCVKRRENAGIIGARRFGKTSLLKSMLSYIESHPESNALPIYFDVKNDFTGIHKDTPKVYYTLAAILAKKMCEMGILQEGNYNISRRCILDVSTDLSDMIVQMSSWHSEYQTKAFFNLTDEVCRLGKYVLLLLDEIDSLLLDALNTPSDFGRIRGAATDKSEKLAFWIAGTSSWKSITTNIGSPELNCGLEQIRLSSLEKKDFSAMWKYECSLIEDKGLCHSLASLEDSVYVKTGGIPYYAKFIGSSFMNGTIRDMPDYSIVRDYLIEIYESGFMSEPERSALKVLANGPRTFKDNLPDGITALESKGLIEVNDSEEYYIAFQYLADYVKAIESNTVIDTLPDIEKRERDMLVDEIIRIRDAVNKAYKNNPPFLTSTEDPIEFNNLRTLCRDESSLFAFATSLCKLYYEGSEKGNRLPVGFFERDFLMMVRALRNKCDHRECEPTQMENDKLFELINNGISPFSSGHFKNIQSKVLALFKDELLLMIDNIHQSEKKEEKLMQVSSQPKQLENGEYYEGVIVEVTKPLGTFLNVKCNLYPYPLKIKSKGENLCKDDVVKFKAVHEPNRNDPNKVYWLADDVCLKE